MGSGAKRVHRPVSTGSPKQECYYALMSLVPRVRLSLLLLGPRLKISFNVCTAPHKVNIIKSNVTMNALSYYALGKRSM